MRNLWRNGRRIVGPSSGPPPMLTSSEWRTHSIRRYMGCRQGEEAITAKTQTLKEKNNEKINH